VKKEKKKISEELFSTFAAGKRLLVVVLALAPASIAQMGTRAGRSIVIISIVRVISLSKLTNILRVTPEHSQKARLLLQIPERVFRAVFRHARLEVDVK
jgi:hypothetical protein